MPKKDKEFTEIIGCRISKEQGENMQKVLKFTREKKATFIRKAVEKEVNRILKQIQPELPLDK